MLREEVMPTSSVPMIPTAITMNSDEFVNAISCPPMWPIVKILLIWN